MSLRTPLRLTAALLFLLIAGLLYFAAVNMWSHIRLRPVPVEVVKSSLLVDAPLLNSGVPGPLELTLRLDLRVADGSNRHIHWEDSAAQAAYPEEAFDELARWAPGTLHSIYQLRGAARTIRLGGSFDAPERNTALIQFFLGAFFSVFELMLLGLLSHVDPVISRLPFVRRAGVWTVFAFTSIACLSGAVILAWQEVPKRIAWPTVTAAIESVDPNYQPESLPRNVAFTPSARMKMKSELNHRVVTFSWNGVTIHGGIGRLDGAYDELTSTCLPLTESCRFVISPVNRWDVLPSANWDVPFLAPIVIFLLFGLGMGRAAVLMWRQSK